MLFGEREEGKENGWPTAAARTAHKARQIEREDNIPYSGAVRTNLAPPTMLNRKKCPWSQTLHSVAL